MPNLHASPALRPRTNPYVTKPEKDGKVTTITAEIETQLSEYVVSLVTRSEVKINAEERNIKAELEGIIANFDRLCDVLEASEKCLDTDITTERLELRNASNEGSAEIVSLDERMKQFRAEVKDRTIRIEDLWEAWSMVQQEIICLAVEALSKDVVEDDGHDLEAFRTVVAEAHTKYQSDHAQREDSEKGLQRLQTRLEGLSNTSMLNSKQILKDASDMDREQKKCLAVVLNTLGNI